MAGFGSTAAGAGAATLIGATGTTFCRVGDVFLFEVGRLRDPDDELELDDVERRRSFLRRREEPLADDDEPEEELDDVDESRALRRDLDLDRESRRRFLRRDVDRESCRRE